MSITQTAQTAQTAQTTQTAQMAYGADRGTTVPGTGRPVVSLGELQRAWEAIQAGRFRNSQQPPRRTGLEKDIVDRGDVPQVWSPTETVVPIMGAGGAVGATTIAVALASACPAPARVVECGSATRSGLAPASTAELGTSSDSAWRRGLRQGEHGPVLLERAARPISHAAQVPLPATAETGRPVAVTFLDCSWELDHLLAEGWLADQVTTAPAVVVAAHATVPGLRHLEVALDLLDDLGVEDVRAAVLGPRRKKWGRLLEGSIGSATRQLDAAGGLFEIPLEKSLAISGLTSDPLPAGLAAAAARLLEQLPQIPAHDPHAGAPSEHDLEPLPGAAGQDL